MRTDVIARKGTVGKYSIHAYIPILPQFLIISSKPALGVAQG